MTCPLCQARPAKRQCPALGRQICAVCCGTKRLVEIRCPADCGYLASSRKHPAAATKRQHEHDVTLLMPAMAEMTDRQSRFFFLFQSIVARHPSDALRPLVDADVAEAADSVARTLDTASRGVIYESTPQSLTAQELARELRPRVRGNRRGAAGPEVTARTRRGKSLERHGRSGPPRGFDRRQRAPGISGAREAGAEAGPAVDGWPRHHGQRARDYRAGCVDGLCTRSLTPAIIRCLSRRPERALGTWRYCNGQALRDL